MSKRTTNVDISWNYLGRYNYLGVLILLFNKHKITHTFPMNLLILESDGVHFGHLTIRETDVKFRSSNRPFIPS